MNSNMRTQIRSRMALKETEELIEIWRTNERYKWSEDAFDVIKEILEERKVEVPEQSESIHDRKELMEEKDFAFSDRELRIIDDENPPEFYNPLAVLVITKRIDWIAKWMIVFTIVYNILNFQRIMGIVQPYFLRNPDSAFMYVLAALVLILNAAIGIVVIYFPLKALAHVLRILMEMEFRSRKAG